MSLRTAFLNLFKPESGDKFSITGTEGYNKNMDLIDEAVKKNANAIIRLNSDIIFEEVSLCTKTFEKGETSINVTSNLYKIDGYTRILSYTYSDQNYILTELGFRGSTIYLTVYNTLQEPITALVRCVMMFKKSL